MSGVCLDALNPAGAPEMDAIDMAGATGARLVAFDDSRFFEYLYQLDAMEFTVAVVIARESCANDDFGGWASYYAERIAPTYWVLGNEMDAYLLAEPSPSSWKMTPEEYADFWHKTATAIRARQPEAGLVVGGLVSGQPAWATAVQPLLDPRPDAWDVHPYGKDAAGTEELLNAYLDAAQTRARIRALRAALGGEPRVLILEWNRPAAEIAEYEAMLAEETEWAAWFCWSDGMVPPFGLFDAAGQPKAEYVAFVEGQMPEPNAQIKATMAEFEAAGGTVGQIYTVTDVDQSGWQVANTDAGLFVSQVGVPGAQILLDARAKNPFR